MIVHLILPLVTHAAVLVLGGYLHYRFGSAVKAKAAAVAAAVQQG